MEEVLCDIEDTDVYLNDIGAFSFTWEHHILILDKIIHQLEANGFTANPPKCKWAIQENWLGYWLTLTGLKLWCKKMMACYKCRNRKISHKCMVFLVPSITTNKCGLNVCTFLHPFLSSWERRLFV